MPVIYSDDFLTDYATVSCETPDRVSEIYEAIEDLVEFIEPDLCANSDLLICHTERLIESVKRGSDAYAVARRAAGGAVRAARIALERPSFALIRPPGHHAGRDFNGGFCFFNNIATAIKKLLNDGTIKNALIVDIDLHYGNGTYDIVGNDRRITFRNIDAATREEFFVELDDVAGQAPSFDIVGCSVGFDTYIKDWGNLLLTEDFRRIGATLASANRHFFSVLEGGYYIPDLGLNARAYLEGIREACS
jgi:acetoin utilization deacetylase AcuC-like enzyme